MKALDHESLRTYSNWHENTHHTSCRWSDPKVENFSLLSASFEFCPWEMAFVYSHMCFILSCCKTFAVPEWISSKGILAYSCTSWPPLPHPGVCFCSALSWHFDKRLTLRLLTGKVCTVIINSWSLDISGCMLQISHYTGACSGAENANLKAFSLQFSPSRW